jgi:hypothetical protein
MCFTVLKKINIREVSQPLAKDLLLEVLEKRIPSIAKHKAKNVKSKLMLNTL